MCIASTALMCSRFPSNMEWNIYIYIICRFDVVHSFDFLTKVSVKVGETQRNCDFGKIYLYLYIYIYQVEKVNASTVKIITFEQLEAHILVRVFIFTFSRLWKAARNTMHAVLRWKCVETVRRLERHRKDNGRVNGPFYKIFGSPPNR